MSTAEQKKVEIDDADAITEVADMSADRHGLEEAIQRYWIAIGHLKKRQQREGQ